MLIPKAVHSVTSVKVRSRMAEATAAVSWKRPYQIARGGAGSRAMVRSRRSAPLPWGCVVGRAGTRPGEALGSRFGATAADISAAWFDGAAGLARTVRPGSFAGSVSSAAWIASLAGVASAAAAGAVAVCALAVGAGA